MLGFGNMKNYKNSYKIFYKKILRKKKLIEFGWSYFFENFRNLVKKNNIDGYILATPVSSHYEYTRKLLKEKNLLLLKNQS